MVVNSYRPDLQDDSQEKAKKKSRIKSIIKWSFFSLVFLVSCFVIGLLVYEARTSTFQARQFSDYATTLTYKVDQGPSSAIIFPGNGPFDTRLGYALLPKLLDRVQSKGMHIETQSRFSPQLLDYASRGFFTPYHEKTQTGLNIQDSNGSPMYQYSYPGFVYSTFDSIPPLIVNSLLFIENRSLLDTSRQHLNPAVDWVRFTKASLHEIGNIIGLEYKTIGGSTLATQIEKFRHSPGGITVDAREKMKQMVSASVRVYQGGPETMPARKELVVSYLNTVPLSGAPGYGEVHGLGDGLKVWFDSDVKKVNKLLSLTDVNGDTLQAKGQALRQVLSLMIAHRRPSYYLGHEGRQELSDLTGGYLRLLASNGYISTELRDISLSQEVRFRDFDANPAVAPKSTDKGALVARTHLSRLLGKPLYDLDRMDMAATTTLNHDLQAQVSDYLHNLNNPEFANTVGVFGERMLSPNRTETVIYSFTLFERTPYGNLVRVQTDNTDQPFDMNEGSKLELGSTAKLRVMVTYLEIIAEIHKKYAEATPAQLKKGLQDPHDNLTKWVMQHLLISKDKSLTNTLRAALDRRYSASPGEAFFTGGGMHHFRNFNNDDNYSRPTVREAFQKSINLPFVRLMRDIVSYTMYQQVGNPSAILANAGDTRREEYLQRFADREGKVFLRKYWNKYKGLSAEERFTRLLNSIHKDEVRLAVVHRFLYPNKDYRTFKNFMLKQLPKEKQNIKEDRVQELYERYGPDKYNLSDQGYIAKRHPLELWLLSYLLKYPGTRWHDAVVASEQHRQDIYKWLFRTKYKGARDSRIRTIMESDAYIDIHKRWARLGYPFKQLVPSLATALGSSGDRPEALAELMGIIMNNGVQQRTIRIEEIHFAALTPYETSLKWKPLEQKQVLEPTVAAIVKEALSEVVEAGTARRLQGGFKLTDGTTLTMGGKTGTGDNRVVTTTTKGYKIASRAINRTATFVFFIGEDHFGTLTAYVPGRESADFHFTSSLPVQVLRGMGPILEPYLEAKLNNGQPPKDKEPQVILAEEQKTRETPALKTSCCPPNN